MIFLISASFPTNKEANLIAWVKPPCEPRPDSERPLLRLRAPETNQFMLLSLDFKDNLRGGDAEGLDSNLVSNSRPFASDVLLAFSSVGINLRERTAAGLDANLLANLRGLLWPLAGDVILVSDGSVNLQRGIAPRLPSDP